jgi:hypothetical protein
MMDRRRFLGGLVLAAGLSPCLTGAFQQKGFHLRDLWPLGNQIFSVDPELANRLMATITPDLQTAVANRLNEHRTDLQQGCSCIEINPDSMSSYQGWVLPTDLLRLAVEVRNQLGPWI